MSVYVYKGGPHMYCSTCFLQVKAEATLQSKADTRADMLSSVQFFYL